MTTPPTASPVAAPAQSLKLLPHPPQVSAPARPQAIAGDPLYAAIRPQRQPGKNESFEKHLLPLLLLLLLLPGSFLHGKQAQNW